MIRRVFNLLLIALTLLWSAPVLAVDVTQDRFDLKGTTVTQSFLISRPTLVPLSFGYCNGQNCGNPQDPDLDCYVNLYNPTFADNFPDKISITPPNLARPGKVFVRQANTGGGYYAFDPKHPNTNIIDQNILSSQPNFNADGSITVTFNQGPIQAFKDFKKAASGSGRICGITAEQLANFKQQYGAAFDNTSFDTRLTFVWQFDEAPYSANPYDQTVTINGKQMPFTGIMTTQPPPSTPTVSPQADASATISAATSTLLNNLRTTTTFKPTSWVPSFGIVPALAASDLAHQPTDVEAALIKANVINKDGLVDWQTFMTYLRDSEKLSVQEVDVVTLMHSLDQQATPKQVRVNGLGLTAYTVTDSNGSSRESALVIFGSDSKGNLIVGDPTSRRTQPTLLPYEKFLKGNPWIMLINRP